VRCQEIVEGLLDLARPGGRVAVEAVSLRELSEEVVARLREAARLGRVAVAVEGDARAWAHPQRVRQVLFNLVKNAAEAAGEAGRVQVHIEGGADGGARVAVSDTGPGVRAEDRTRLFEPFFTTKASGTGLGLAVSQAIAHAHGGHIEADTGPLGGARFTLYLPPAAEGVA
jgi:signal transduction histidine kinase